MKRNSVIYRHSARDSHTQNQPQVQLQLQLRIWRNQTVSYIQTLSGKKFNYLNATVDDIEIEDIATALSHLCRFCGHLPEFYSVAQHSVLCSQLVPPMFAFEALMHDAGKVYLPVALSRPRAYKQHRISQRVWPLRPHRLCSVDRQRDPHSRWLLFRRPCCF